MAITQFPAPSSGSAGGNNVILDIAGTSNNTFELGAAFPAGGYSVSLSTSDNTYDVYLLNAAGVEVGYGNGSSIAASEAFTTVVVLGVVNTEKLTLSFIGSTVDASSAGQETGAGPYITSVSPTALPTVNNTTTVVGGNFATDVQVFFDSGATTIAAKAVVRNSNLSLTVTRPDNLNSALAPWTLRVVNPGVDQPTGSNVNKFVGITSGAAPVWTTTSLPGGIYGSAYSQTVVATDVDGVVVYSVASGSLPTGLTLNAASGLISGTIAGNASSFTLRATDTGNNYTDQAFTIAVQLATGGTVTQGGGYTYHTFTSSGTFQALAPLTAQYVVVGGGGGGSVSYTNYYEAGAGGGAGGYRSSFAGGTTGGGGTLETPLALNAGSYTVTIGGGGSGGSGTGGTSGGSGGTTTFANITSTGGGYGSTFGSTNGATGGSGGGGYANYAPGNGTAGQGYAGNRQNGGGGAAGSGSGGDFGGAGIATTTANGSLTLSVGGGNRSSGGAGGYPGAAGANYGSGGQGGGVNTGGNSNFNAGGSGATGVVIVRY